MAVKVSKTTLVIIIVVAVIIFAILYNIYNTTEGLSICSGINMSANKESLCKNTTGCTWQKGGWLTPGKCK